MNVWVSFLEPMSSASGTTQTILTLVPWSLVTGGFGVQFPRATLGSNFLYPVTGRNLRLEGGKGHLTYTASSG